MEENSREEENIERPLYTRPGSASRYFHTAPERLWSAGKIAVSPKRAFQST